MPVRTQRGRPRRGEAAAPTRKVTVRLPEELVPVFEKLAQEHGRSLHAELRAALAFWADAHTAKSEPHELSRDPDAVIPVAVRVDP